MSISICNQKIMKGKWGRIQLNKNYSDEGYF